MSRSLVARKPVEKEALDLSGTNITTAAWVTIVPATSQPCSGVEIYNSSGSILRLSTGSVGNEAANEIPYFVLPDRSVLLPVEIAKGKRIAGKAVNVNADQGYLVLNMFG